MFALYFRDNAVQIRIIPELKLNSSGVACSAARIQRYHPSTVAVRCVVTTIHGAGAVMVGDLTVKGWSKQVSDPK